MGSVAYTAIKLGFDIQTTFFDGIIPSMTGAVGMFKGRKEYSHAPTADIGRKAYDVYWALGGAFVSLSGTMAHSASYMRLGIDVGMEHPVTRIVSLAPAAITTIAYGLGTLATHHLSDYIPEEPTSQPGIVGELHEPETPSLEEKIEEENVKTKRKGKLAKGFRNLECD